MQLNNVSFSYHQQSEIIHNVSADVTPGHILSIVGPNGAGKTTLSKLMTGELKPSRGAVMLDGEPLSQLTRKQRADQIAIVSQQNQLYDDMKVIDVVKMGRLAKHGLLAAIDDQEVAPYLAMTGLQSFANRPMSQLSGGQKQRVWIAAAIAQDPQYLFLDEPTTYLDIRYQTELMAIIEKLHRQQQMTIVMILHDINQAFRMSDDIWLIKAGKLVSTGQPNQFYDERSLSEIFNTAIRIVSIPDYGKYIVELPDGAN